MNKTNPSAACPVPLDTNRAGTGGQQLKLAKAQLGSHYPETRCALSVKKPYSVSCGYIKTIHSWLKTLCIFKLAWFWISLLTFYTLSGRGRRRTCTHFGFITASVRNRVIWNSEALPPYINCWKKHVTGPLLTHTIHHLIQEFINKPATGNIHYCWAEIKQSHKE